MPAGLGRGEGVAALTTAIVDRIEAGLVEIDLLIPYERGDAVAAAHRIGEVTREEHLDGGTALSLRLPPDTAHEFAEFRID